MPGFGTSSRTRSNAERLAEACGVALETIDITDGCRQQFRDIGQDRSVQDVTFENVQARYRTMILMNKANQLRALVVGTGDLSEIALGWNTFNGDHMSHYNVNAGRAEDARPAPGGLGGRAAAVRSARGRCSTTS